VYDSDDEKHFPLNRRLNQLYNIVRTLTLRPFFQFAAVLQNDEARKDRLTDEELGTATRFSFILCTIQVAVLYYTVYNRVQIVPRAQALIDKLSSYSLDDLFQFVLSFSIVGGIKFYELEKPAVD
jgi:hypothetical protein